MDCKTDDQKIRVQLPGGTIIGNSKNGQFRARGIKYAEFSRFKSPVPITTWVLPVDGTQPATVCPQNPSRLNSVTGDLIHGRSMDEDCLHLTIDAPAHALSGKTKLPTVVFLHGGANVSGGGDLDCYGGQGLTERGLVVVSVTYRLGIFGWYPIEGLAPPNLGLLDQIEALRWVQRNISGVGGDPAQVTVIGHSVGAYAIFCMMLADDTSGLFQRAILQSTPFGWQQFSGTASDKLGRITRSQLGSDPLALSVEELLAAQVKLVPEAKRLGLRITPAWAHFGKYPLPDESEIPERLQKAAATYRIIVGWTQHESTAFVPMKPNYSFWSKLPLIGPLYKNAASWWYSHTEFIWPSQQFSRSFTEVGGRAATYCFRWYPSRNPLGAVHCIDLPFVFGLPGAWKDAPMLKGPKSEQVLEGVGRGLKDSFAVFASAESFPDVHMDIEQDFSFNIDSDTNGA